MNILGDSAAKAGVTLLLDSGVDLHSYQPTAPDILKISGCDVFICVDGESDEWVEDVLEQAINKDMIVVNLLSALGDAAKEEELVEGMQAEAHDHDHDEDAHDDHDEDHDHEEDHDEDHDHGEAELDEHVWLSLKNASRLVESICQALGQADPENAAAYQINAEAYREKLSALDARYAGALAEARCQTLLFGDRFPFRYLVDDYGLSYYAAFIGCSAETEASFETIAFLAGKLDELGLPAVMTIEGRDHRIAQTIIQSSKIRNQRILTLDSMQAVTAKDVQNGASYLSIMEKNLSVLSDALR